MPIKKSKRATLMVTLKIGVLLVALVLMGGGVLFAYYAKDLPSPAAIQELKIAESTKIYDRTGTILLYDIHGEQRRTVISYEEIPDYMKWATIVAEDDGFYQHFGIDIMAIGRAFLANIRGQGVLQGGSTITQQLIKNIYLSPERTLSRKIKEIILALEMEIKYSKDTILDFYLNIVPYGSNAYGVEAASQTFFGKHAQDLTLAESALLASLTKGTTYYSPFGNNPEKLKERQEYILERMLGLGYINEEQLREAQSEEPAYSSEYRGIKAPHFVMYIREILEQKYGEGVLKSSGFTVITTLDWTLQQEAERIVKKWGEKNETRFRAENAALVALDPHTGQILAMVGSRDYFDVEHDGNVNVTTRPRQPGSSFKPFVYAAAFQKGYTPDTVVFDVETNFGVQGTKEYIPGNYTETFQGPVTFKEALAQSINIPAVKVLYLAGISETLSLAQKMGFTTLTDPSRYGLSLSLGGGEVMLLEEVAAYGVFATEGIRTETIGVLSVTKKDNGDVTFPATRRETVLDQQITRRISDILSRNDLRAPLFGTTSYLNLATIPAAVKTGTTQDYRDAWTIGYTPDIAVGVWVGNNDNTKMYKAPGSQAAAPIWYEFMKKTYGLAQEYEAQKKNDTSETDKEYAAGAASPFIPSWPPRDFIPPEALSIEKPILKGSLGGTAMLRIDTISGKRATEYTPEELIEERTFAAPHSILYFVDKNNPSGVQPKNPEIDPQFAAWEEAVQQWLEEIQQSEEQRTSHAYLFDIPPDEYDDVHTPQTIPHTTITSPSEGSVVYDNTLLSISLDLANTYPVQKIELFFDDKIIKTLDGLSLKNTSYTTQIRLPSLGKTKNHRLMVKVFDSVLNRSETIVSLRSY